MKTKILIAFLLYSNTLFLQDKMKRSQLLNTDVLEVVTIGLDDVEIKNTEEKFIEVLLVDNTPSNPVINIVDENGVTKINFKEEEEYDEYESEVFRKFITKRLHRARAVIKIPKNKEVIIYGETIGIHSEKYEGDIRIYIDRGNIQLGNFKGNATIKLFIGNVVLHTSNSNLNLTTTKGRILINEEEKTSPFVKDTPSFLRNITVNSIHANIKVESN